jgi:hypothetical protein
MMQSGAQMTPQMQAMLQQLMMAQNAMPSAWLQQMYMQRQTWGQNYGSNPSAFFGIEGSGELTTEKILLFGALGIGALALLTRKK